MTKRICDQTPEERELEAKLLRDEFDEADRFDRPALTNMMQRIEREDTESEDLERTGDTDEGRTN